MAEEILVKDQLTDKMIRAGKHLLDDLKAADFEYMAGFWLYNLERNNWQLTLVVPTLDKDGPRKILFQILEVLEKGSRKSHGLDLSDISLLSPDDPLVKALASVNSLLPLSNKRLTRNSFGPGIFVEDIYIYFIEGIEPLPGMRWVLK